MAVPALVDESRTAGQVKGQPEVVVHGETGLIVPPEDSVALAEAVTYLLEHPAEADRMGHTAARRAAELFDWDRYLDASEELYREIVARATAAPSA